MWWKKKQKVQEFRESWLVLVTAVLLQYKLLRILILLSESYPNTKYITVCCVWKSAVTQCPC